MSVKKLFPKPSNPAPPPKNPKQTPWPSPVVEHNGHSSAGAFPRCLLTDSIFVSSFFTGILFFFGHDECFGQVGALAGSAANLWTMTGHLPGRMLRVPSLDTYPPAMVEQRAQKFPLKTPILSEMAAEKNKNVFIPSPMPHTPTPPLLGI